MTPEGETFPTMTREPQVLDVSVASFSQFDIEVSHCNVVTWSQQNCLVRFPSWTPADINHGFYIDLVDSVFLAPKRSRCWF